MYVFGVRSIVAQAYDDQLCRPINWTATNTTCACSADASAVASEGGGASFTSGAEALAGYFASMFDASAFGANLFMQNPLLMATFGTILILVLLNMARAVLYLLFSFLLVYLSYRVLVLMLRAVPFFLLRFCSHA